MAKKGGNPENLKPHNFKKGESGNPAGRPEGSHSLKSILDRLLQKQISIEDLEGQTIKVTAKEAIALNMIAAAVTAEDENIMLKAAKQVFEHTDAITKDLNISLTPTNGGEMSDSQFEALRKAAESE